jgi:HPt (histidine-containing phosphotransfer) domain-containing protein
MRAKRFPGSPRPIQTLQINHVAVYAGRLRMKTTRPAQLANVVNASVTMFFQSVQRLSTDPPAGRQQIKGAMLDRSAGLDPPIDLVHLGRQCLGDHALEAELLGLFRLQARAWTAQLSGAPLLSSESKARIAHTLRGSALAIGARRVARAAWRIEELASGARDQGSAEASAIAALQSAVAEALTEIDRIRG